MCVLWIFPPVKLGNYARHLCVLILQYGRIATYKMYSKINKSLYIYVRKCKVVNWINSFFYPKSPRGRRKEKVKGPLGHTCCIMRYCRYKCRPSKCGAKILVKSQLRFGLEPVSPPKSENSEISESEVPLKSMTTCLPRYGMLDKRLNPLAWYQSR